MQYCKDDFRLQDIFAYEDDRSPSGVLIAIRVTLTDGSHRICQGEDIKEFLALVEQLKVPFRLQSAATKPKKSK